MIADVGRRKRTCSIARAVLAVKGIKTVSENCQHEPFGLDGGEQSTR